MTTLATVSETRLIDPGSSEWPTSVTVGRNRKLGGGGFSSDSAARRPSSPRGRFTPEQCRQWRWCAVDRAQVVAPFHGGHGSNTTRSPNCLRRNTLGAVAKATARSRSIGSFDSETFEVRPNSLTYNACAGLRMCDPPGCQAMCRVGILQFVIFCRRARSARGITLGP